jgi:hypothetical protein
LTPLQSTSYVILWCLVIILFTLVLVLYRQYGLMLMPPRRRIDLGGLDLGKRAPLTTAHSSGAEVQFDWKSQTAGSFVLVAIAWCPICEQLRHVADAVASQWEQSVTFYWLDSSEPAANPLSWIQATSLDESAHRTLGAPASPYGYFFDKHGLVQAKGLVGSAQDIHEIIQRGFAAAGIVLSAPVKFTGPTAQENADAFT